MKKNIVWILVLLCSLRAYSQSESSLQRVNIKSPEVAALMKVGDIPVSLYTGVPQISVPIYEVKCGELRLPISLDYQGTAIQVNQEATWVGLNWLLNAGEWLLHVPRSLLPVHRQKTGNSFITS